MFAGDLSIDRTQAIDEQQPQTCAVLPGVPVNPISHQVGAGVTSMSEPTGETGCTFTWSESARHRRVTKRHAIRRISGLHESSLDTLSRRLTKWRWRNPLAELRLDVRKSRNELQ
jgi:hypothetical protein